MFTYDPFYQGALYWNGHNVTIGGVAPYLFPRLNSYGFYGQIPGYPARVNPPLQGGPERSGERSPHAVHVDWHARYPTEIILHGPTDRKEVAFTFDDGPDDYWTPRILAVLNAIDVKGTFMCVGQRVQQNPSVLQQLVQTGHVIGNHSWSHPNFTKITAEEVQFQTEQTENLIERVVGVRPRFFRPPYGALNGQVIQEIMRQNYKILFWNVDSLDWSGITAEQASSNVLAHAGPGSIILMHCAGGSGESLEDTVLALPHIVHVLRSEGYTFKTIPELLGVPAYQV